MDVWVYCYQSHACEPEALYPTEFQQAADAILACDFGMRREEIKLENAQVLYLHLVNEMSN